MISREISAFQALSWLKEVSLKCGKYMRTRTRNRPNSNERLSFSTFIDHLHAVAGSES